MWQKIGKIGGASGSVISVLCGVLLFFVQSRILAAVGLLCTLLALAALAVCWRKKPKLNFFLVCAILLLPLLQSVRGRGYEFFDASQLLIPALCCAACYLLVLFYQTPVRKMLLPFLLLCAMSIVCFGSLLKLADVDLDWQKRKTVQAAVTEKSVSYLKEGYQFFAEVDAGSHGILEVMIPYEVSRTLSVGDTLPVTVGKGLFGIGYYFYDTPGDKVYWDFHMIIASEDEVYAYTQELPQRGQS